MKSMDITDSERVVILDIFCTLANYGAVGKTVNNEYLTRYRDIYVKLCKQWEAIPYLKLDPRSEQGDKS